MGPFNCMRVNTTGSPKQQTGPQTVVFPSLGTSQAWVVNYGNAQIMYRYALAPPPKKVIQECSEMFFFFNYYYLFTLFPPSDQL